ncbi:MAG: PAS domain S-box protein, partial [Planctomycetota bacterium]
DIVIGKSDDDFYPEEEARRMADDDKALMRTGRPIIAKEEKVTRPDGHVHWVSTTKVPRYDPRGRVIGTMGISRDITERKEAEDALRKSEEEWRSLVENLPDIIVTVGRDGTVLALNRSVLPGVSIDDAIGWSVYDYVDPEQRELVRTCLEAAYETAQPQQYQALGHGPKKADQALGESRERLELAIEGSRGGLWDMAFDPDDPNHAILDEIYLSPRLKGFIGYEDHEFPSSLEAWNNRVLPEDLPRLKQVGREYISGAKDQYEVGYRIRHKDESIRWIRSCGKLTRDESGNPVRWTGIDWDVTDEKQAEEALRESQESLEHAVDGSGGALWVTYLEPGTKPPKALDEAYFSPGLKEFIGYDGDEFPNSLAAWDRLILPEDQERVTKASDDLLAGLMDLLEVEYRIRHRDGSLRWIHSRSRIVRDENGEPVRWTGIDWDITERKKAEGALRESEVRYRTTINSMADPIHVVDKDLRILLANSSLERWNQELGLETSVVGRKLMEVFPFLGPQVLEEYKEVFETGDTLATEEKTEVAGREYITETRKIPVATDGEVTAVVTVIRDITSRRRAEEVLRESEERFRLLVETSYSGIDISEIVSEQEPVLFCNDRYTELYDFERRGAGFVENPDGEGTYYDPDGHAREWDERLEKGLPCAGMLTWTPPGGQERFIEWSSIVARGGGKKLDVGVDRQLGSREELKQKLEEKAERFHLPFNSVSDGIGLCRLVGGRQRLIFCNDRYAEMSGRTRSQLEDAEDIAALLVHQEAQERIREWKDRVQQGLPCCGVSSWQRPDGKENYVEWSAIRLDAPGESRVLTVFRQLSGRAEAEERIADVEGRFCLPVDARRDGVRIAEYVPAGRRLVFCNDRYVEMSGYTREELENADDIDGLQVCHSGAREYRPWRTDRRQGADYTYSGVSSWKRPDGKENYHEWTGVWLQMGDKPLIFGISRDVTEQRGAAEALRESEERFRLLVESAFDGISICELESGGRQLIFCNDHYAEMAGRSRGQLADSPDLDGLVTHHTPEDERQQWRDRAHRSLPYSGISSWIRPDGRENFYEWSALWIKGDGQGRLFSVHRDITERMQAGEGPTSADELFRLPFDGAHDAFTV